MFQEAVALRLSSDAPVCLTEVPKLDEAVETQLMSGTDSEIILLVLR